VPIWSGSKKPFEPRWNVPGGNNYPYNSPKLAAYLLEGHNWGTCTGMGDLIIFDSDNELRLQEIGVAEQLPGTFTVRTGGGGLHRYYICSDAGDKIIMYDREAVGEDGKPLHLGEVQTLGFQAVGPGSLHPNGNKYKVEVDAPITTVSWKDIYEILEPKVEFGLAERQQQKRLVVRVKRPGETDPFEGLYVEDILRPKGKTTSSGGIIKGAHPVHGSNGGHNFQINTNQNTWFCFRCWKGGGPALAIAVKEGLIRCDQAGKGVLRGDLYLKLLEIAQQQGYINKPKKYSVERIT